MKTEEVDALKVGDRVWVMDNFWGSTWVRPGVVSREGWEWLDGVGKGLPEITKDGSTRAEYHQPDRIFATEADSLRAALIVVDEVRNAAEYDEQKFAERLEEIEHEAAEALEQQEVAHHG